MSLPGFHYFAIKPGEKTPLRKGWQEEAGRVDCAAILAAGYNVGIYTGRYGDEGALLVVDVDMKGDKRGDDAILALDMEGFELPPTLTALTPTGGRHLFYRVPHAVRQSAGRLGQGLDVRSRGGYVVGAGSVVPAGAYRWLDPAHPIVPAPEWLIERCGGVADAVDERPSSARVPGVDHAAALDRALAYLKDGAAAGAAGSRNEEAFRVAARIKDLGLEPDACFEAMAEHWACEPPLEHDELRHVVNSAYAYGRSAQGSAAPEADFSPVPPADVVSPLGVYAPTATQPAHPFERLNREYAFVIAGGGAHILWETTNADGAYKLEHLATGAFHAKHAAEKFQVGKRTEPLTMAWMEWKGRRSYDGLVFKPEQTAPARFYNLWRGFAVEPWNYDEAPSHAEGTLMGANGPAANALGSFLHHALHNVCRGDDKLFEWLMGYFAHLVQRPWEKPLTALVFKGEKGVGKNALIRLVGNLLGHHYLVTSNRRYLVGNFNGHLEHTLLFVLDEAFWSGDKQGEGVLKDLITGSHHVIEHKGKEPYTIDNYTRIVILGNEDWLVPASSDERRFAVFDVGSGRKQDTKFFENMRVGMEAGGNRLLLRYLLDYPISNVNVAPATAGLSDQKHASLEPFPAWWFACLSAGKLVGGDFEAVWPAEADTDRFRNAFRRYAKERNIKGWMPDDRSAGRQLRKMAPSAQKGRLASGPTYKLPTLDAARAEWEKFIGHEVHWE